MMFINLHNSIHPIQTVTAKKIPQLRKAFAWALVVLTLSAHGTGLVTVTNPINYGDGRPYPSFRMDAVDQGKFLDYGQGPNQCDYLGAREALINYVNGKYYLYYDGAGPLGWVACLAESTNLTTWTLKGPVIDFGLPGTADSACACSPWIIQDATNLWHMYYLATPNTTGGEDKVPIFPYTTLHATSTSPAGPWTKHYTPIPFTTQGGTYYSSTASPGHVVKQGSEYLMLISTTDSSTKRTISIARTTDLNGVWTVDPTPALPVTEQIENSSLYYEPTNQTWFLFTNHIGAEGGVEFGTDAVWVYWTQDLNVWNPACKAIVLDGSNCTWSSKCIGMPSVVQVGDKLKIFYDAPGGTSSSSMRRSLGMATLQLPLDISLVSGSTVPVQNGSFETPGTGIGGPWAKFGAPWPLIGLPSNYQQMQVVSGDAFSSTVAGGGTWAALLSTHDVPIAHPLVQNLPRSVSTGDTLSVTFWLGRPKGSTGGQAVAYFDVGGTKYSTAFNTTLLTADSWQSMTLTQTIANSGNLSLGFYATTTANSWLDKISDVTVTPAVVDPNVPSSTNATLTALEDTPTALAAGNFGYADPLSVALAAVQITSLPVLGSLKLGGTAVTNNTIVSAADITNLTYQAASNENGTPYTTMGIKVMNASNLWSLAAVMTVNVTAVNDAPVAFAQSVTRLLHKTKSITLTGSDLDNDPLTYVLVTGPAHGTLSGTAPNVTYTSTGNAAGVDAFTFKVNDGTTNSAPATVTITLSASALAEDFEHEWADNVLANTTNGWHSGTSDQSSIANPAVGYDPLPSGVIHPLVYDHSAQRRILKLNTGNDTLVTPDTDAAFASAKVYVDMLVNLDVCLNVPAALSNDVNAKTMVFLKSDGTSTNLHVFHGQREAGAFKDPTFTAVITNSVEPGTWHRLTITLDSTTNGTGAEAFSVRLDGKALVSAKAYSDGWKSRVFATPCDPDGGTWFLSAARRTGTEGTNVTSLARMGFTGWGYIDDLSVTYQQPIFSYGTILMLR